MNNEPFDEHLSWELRTLVEDANPPPTLRPATAVRTRSLPRPWILIGSVAAVIMALLALVLSGGSDHAARQHVASEGKNGESATTTENAGVLVPIQGEQGATATTAPGRRSTSATTPKKSTPTTAHVIDNGAVAHPTTPLAITHYSLGDWLYFGITMGPDGNMWTVSWTDVARITPTGQVTKFAYRGPINGNGQTTAITTGPDGNLWFTEWGGDKVGRITPSGAITQFDVPAIDGITPGPDGALWFSQPASTMVNGQWTGRQPGMGRITTSGEATSYPTPGEPQGITRGSDGNLWFADSNSKIGRITPSGVISEYSIQHNSRGVALGPDGNVWFQSDYNAGTVGRITPAGQVKEFDGAGGTSWTTAIAAGPDGNIWSVDQEGHVFRIDTSGKITTFTNGDGAGYGETGIAAGPGGTLWVTDSKGVGVFKPPAA